jgi:hypothetical protein
VPLLIFSAISAQAAAFVVSATVEVGSFSVLVHLTLLAGLAVSLQNLRRRLPLDWLAYLVMAGALAAFAVRDSGTLPAVLYPNVARDPNLEVAMLLVWMLAGFGFVQYRRRNLIFVSACGAALFGLIGVINLEPGFLVAFGIYLFTTIMAWSYEALTARAAPGAAAMWWRVARGQATSAALVLAGVTAAAYLVSTLLYLTILSPFGSNARVPRMLSWAGALMSGNFSSQPYLAVGAGPANLGNQVLFHVKADYPGLWRSRVYDHYDGQTWGSTNTWEERMTRVGWGSFRGDQNPAPSARLNHQQFWVGDMATSNVVLGAIQPVAVSFQTQWGLTVNTVQADAYGCLTAAPVIMPGGGFTVTSAMPEEDPVKLRAAGTAYPPALRATCINDVPLTTQTELGDLAQQLTAGARTPYDKVEAVQSYLEDNYYYTDQEPVTPGDQDAAAFFLLHSKRGACDLFATSLAVLLRLAGVPARVATGFISGDDDPATGTQLIRAKDAHAWVEVYFPRYGWVPFNPAPQKELEQQSLWKLLKSGQSLYALGKAAKAVGLGALVLALAGLLLMAAVDPRVMQARWRELRVRREPWDRAAREARAAGAALLAALELPPGPPGETPLEAVARAGGPHPLPPPAHADVGLAGEGVAGEKGASSAAAPLDRLRALLGEYYRLRYGPTPGDRDQVLALARDLRELRRRIPRRRR